MTSPALRTMLIGETIGNYRVLTKLGAGGMGSVYLAEHPLIGKKVALKVLNEEYAANEEIVTRFFTEAKAVNDIGHPNIVDIIDYGVTKTASGKPIVYFMMEYLDGMPLSELLHVEAPLSVERAFEIAERVADALAASHSKGIVHRDLKPDNVFLAKRSREGEIVKVLDFGIAKLTGNSGSSARTRTGIVMGTPQYMSPEQCEGRGLIDHRTDIYSLGVVLFHMLTGKVPFGGEGYGEILVQHLTRPAPRPSMFNTAIPPAVDNLVLKALRKRREERFQSMEEFLGALADPASVLSETDGAPATCQMAWKTPVGLAAPSGAMASGASPSGAMAAGVRPAGASSSGSMVSGVRPAVASSSGSMVSGVRPAMSTSSAGFSVVPGSTADAMAAVKPPRGRMVLFTVLGVALVGLLAGGGFLLTRGKSAPSGQPESVASGGVAPAGTSEAPAVDVTQGIPEVVTIDMVSSPEGADVLVAGVVLGKTPLGVKLPKGETRQITLRLAGYEVWQEPVEALGNVVMRIALAKEVPAVKGKAEKRIESTPRERRTKEVEGNPGSDDVLAPQF